MNRLPVAPAHTLAERAEEQRWLVDGLWSEEAVGIIGGEPKCCKSFLALDLAVSIAAGTPCLRRFAVQQARTRPALRRRGCSAYRAAPARRYLRRRRPRSRRSRCPGDHRPQPAPRPRCRPRQSRRDHRSAETAPARPRPLRPPPPDRREHQRRGRAIARLSARPAAASCRQPSSSSTTPAKAPATSAPARPCAARPSSTPGATPISISARDGDDRITLSVEHRAAPAMPRAHTRTRPKRADALALEVVDRIVHAPQPVAHQLRRRSHHRRTRRCRTAAAVRRSARPLPGAHRHPLRTPRRHDLNRTHHQIRRRLPSRAAEVSRFPLPLPTHPTGLGKRKWEVHQNPCSAVHQKTRRRSCAAGTERARYSELRCV